ncbi:MAG: peptidase M49 [Acidobacteria bacterium]|nr:peptidase M49 [Acidobacteriota bacterium]
MTSPTEAGTRPYLLEQIDEAAVVQLYADGFGALPVSDKILIWHLYQAALAGRDIYYDQRHRHALEMRDVLEAVLRHGAGVDDDTLSAIRRYTKLFWINSGPYNNLTARKFVLPLEQAAFQDAVEQAASGGATLPLRDGEGVESLVARLAPMFFDPAFEPLVTSKAPEGGTDILQASANNLYSGVTMTDVASGGSAGFVERHGLNSRLVKHDKHEGGFLEEQVYREDGLYGSAIGRITRHLEDAMPHATPAMRRALEALVRFYRTGDEADRVAYDIAWVEDKDSPVDTINGFVEVYMDARGVKGAWEALVYYVNPEKTAGIQRLAAAAAWFEARMPWDPTWRRPDVRGVTAKAIDVVVETGDSGPVTPVGINLPNDQAIREAHGSKSVSLSNVAEAYDKSTPESFRREFAWSDDEAARAERWSSFASELTTNIHEVLGHGSGRVAGPATGYAETVQPHLALKELYSTLEETRADLVALYFVADAKMIELDLVPAGAHEEIVRAEYEAYARNALVQLRRVREGSTIEEDHMRNRQLIVHWLLANSGAIEIRRREGKTYHVVVDPAAFREGAGRLLAEVQRIKSEGDYAAGRALVETYAVHFDPALRDEIVRRVASLNMPSYTGFVQPKLDAVHDARGAIVDVRISYPLDLETQMLEWSASGRA